jgi:hypothetical protein
MNRTLIFHFFAAEAWKNKGYLKLTKKVKKLIFVILTYFDAKIHISDLVHFLTVVFTFSLADIPAEMPIKLEIFLH